MEVLEQKSWTLCGPSWLDPIRWIISLFLLVISVVATNGKFKPKSIHTLYQWDFGFLLDSKPPEDFWGAPILDPTKVAQKPLLEVTTLDTLYTNHCPLGPFEQWVFHSKIIPHVLGCWEWWTSMIQGFSQDHISRHPWPQVFSKQHVHRPIHNDWSLMDLFFSLFILVLIPSHLDICILILAWFCMSTTFFVCIG